MSALDINDTEGKASDKDCSVLLADTTTGLNSELVCACAVEMVAKIPAQASATLVGLINIGLTFKKQWSLACSPASTEPS